MAFGDKREVWGVAKWQQRGCPVRFAGVPQGDWSQRGAGWRCGGDWGAVGRFARSPPAASPALPASAAPRPSL